MDRSGESVGNEGSKSDDNGGREDVHVRCYDEGLLEVASVRKYEIGQRAMFEG